MRTFNISVLQLDNFKVPEEHPHMWNNHYVYYRTGFKILLWALHQGYLTKVFGYGQDKNRFHYYDDINPNTYTNNTQLIHHNFFIEPVLIELIKDFNPLLKIIV